MGGPDDGREHAGACLARAGVDGIGRCAWALSDPVWCHFCPFCVYGVLMTGVREKRRIRRRWDEEWGTIEKEGNIWWLGSGMKGWVDVMGINRWGWICECFSFSPPLFRILLAVPSEPR